ncbi:hypothetical protein NL676_017634 [Syzygium grande]|nr:hypothetical protein NL676_017634 [Syzygium grande]
MCPDPKEREPVLSGLYGSWMGSDRTGPGMGQPSTRLHGKAENTSLTSTPHFELGSLARRRRRRRRSSSPGPFRSSRRFRNEAVPELSRILAA